MHSSNTFCLFMTNIFAQFLIFFHLCIQTGVQGNLSTCQTELVNRGPLRLKKKGVGRIKSRPAL